MRIKCILDLKELEFQEVFNDSNPETLVNQKFVEFLAALKPTSSDPVQILISLDVRNVGQDSPTKLTYFQRVLRDNTKRNRRL